MSSINLRFALAASLEESTIFSMASAIKLDMDLFFVAA
jgi:hypothetical protein